MTRVRVGAKQGTVSVGGRRGGVRVVGSTGVKKSGCNCMRVRGK